MQNIFLKRFFYVCWLLLACSGPLRAQFEEGIPAGKLNSISCTQGFPSAPNVVTYSSLGETSRKIRNIVRFKIDERALNGTSPAPFLFFKSGFTATATLKVELWNLASAGGGTADVTQTQTLVVNYDTAAGTKYTPIAYLLLNPTGAYEQVRVTINNVVVTGLNTAWTTANVLPVLTVENEMDVLRYFTLSTTASLLAPTSLTGTYDGVNHSDQLSLSWGFPAGANNNLCQLEYAWVENETKAFYNVGGTFDPNTLFKTNSTRVDIDYSPSNTYSYNVPLLYPADPTGGNLYYRVRAVQRKNDGNLVTGPWSAAQSFANSGHQSNMNWQLTTSFSENGKSKTVIQYYDGSLRSRQMVTKDNTTGNTLVAETIYDLQGRPNVQIMPTPTFSTAVQYFSDFNRFAGQSTNDDPAKYFDLAVAGNQCVGAPALDKTRGNGQYFSSNNSWLSTEASAKLIPDANGYGYTETRYTDDPTARLSRQGGIGQSHQIGSGHETKYYYGKPTQNELDALFGTEAGDATHYFKNMVQDANGQMSISYLDLLGHTVATALAGDTIQGRTLSINNNAAFYPKSSGQLTNNLLTVVNNVIKNNSVESISSILVPSPTLYSFTYQLNPAILQQMGCNSQQICFDCKYDLEISIRSEDCSGPPIIKHFSNLQIEPANLACGTSMGFTGDGVPSPTTQINFPITLGTGSWIVRKTLTINDSLLKIREDSALQVFLCKNQQNLQDSVFAALSAATSCGTPAAVRNCSTCQAQLGTYTTYKANYITAVGGSTTLTDAAIHALYTQDSLACADACGTTLNPVMSTLGVLRNQMLGDMIPYTGQYAMPGVATTTLTSKYNIFDASSTYGNIGGRPYYKNPVAEPSGSGTPYTNADGSVDSTVYNLLSGLAADGFTAMFSRSWASQLIYYHPEYSKLHFAETTMASSYAYLDNMLQCNSYAQASTRGYLTPLTSDPYFTFSSNTGYVPADRTAMSGYLTSKVNPSDTGHSSIWRIANGIALTDTTLPQSLRALFLYGVSYTGIDASATTTAQQDAVWQAFRNEYLYYRNDMVVKYINAQQAGSLSAANMAQLINSEQKQLRFVTAQDNATQNGWTWWPAATNYTSVNQTSLANQANAYAAANSVDECVGQRPFWQGKLMQCEQLQQFLLNQTHSDSVKVTTIVNAILDSMVMVCHNSINANNPEGASNVNPAVLPVNPNNFEDIINHVFVQYSIATLPSNYYFCNPYSVDYPKPYNANPPFFVNRSAYVDTCNCHQFALVKSAARVAGYDTTSLNSMNAYLLANYNDTLTLPLWQGLLRCISYNFNHDTCLVRKGGSSGGALAIKMAVAGTSKISTNSSGGIVMPLASVGGDSCITFYKPIALGAPVVIPSFLSCGYVRPCVTCAVLQTYTIAFRSLYPAYAGVPYTGTIDTSMARKNSLWARYLNFKTGLNKLAGDYAAAYVSCNFSTSPSYLLLTNRSTQPPSGSQLPLLYTASDSVVFYQEYTSLDTDNFETLLAAYTGSSGYALCDLAKPVTAYISLPDTTHSNPCQAVQEQANFIGMLLFQQRRDSLIARFDSLYKAKCLSAQSTEVFYATYQPSEYHYTLYYYDQAGNLLKTLPPAAVKPNFDPTYLGQVQTARAQGNDKPSSTNLDNMATQYRYNSLNEVIAQRTPDAGLSRAWYDRLGRVAASQNANQAVSPASYSYTLYDALGRVTEIGQKPQTTPMTQVISQDTTALKNWLNDLTTGGTKVQITRTVYDIVYPGFSGTAPLKGLNLRNRVAYTQVIDADNTNPVPYRAASFFSYDTHGNVDTLVQDYGTTSVMSTNGNRFKLLRYDYDLISGKMNQLSYQPGLTDAFYHQYTYDAENRITSVRTSRDSIQWQTDVTYQYYRHGPMSRMQLGDLLTQGVDYVYTAQGWLKSINPSWINDPSTNDLYDADGTGSTAQFERDAYKLNLNYFDDGTYSDYKPVSAPAGYVQGNTLAAAARFNLYNGNISSMAVNIRKLTTGAAYAGPLIYNYKYDQLNRIRNMDAWAANGSFGPTGSSPLQDYGERYAYDPSGNILTLVRRGMGTALAMDSMTYNYAYVKTDGTRGEFIPGQTPASGVDHLTNQLSSIGDISSSGYDDIKNQPVQNYHYDQIGNLIYDGLSGITGITWNVYGKILTIIKAGGTITYSYDAAGNRISKNSGGITTWYVRDATGNVMATYVQGDNTKNAGALTETELQVYGGSRVGILNLNVNCTSLIAPASNAWVRGGKLFELTNHLGNVLVTVTDKKLQHTTDGTNVDYYRPDVASASDYYPFGMQMPGRTFSSGSYRYGFNGKENDNEVKGAGDQQDYGMRVYDPRIGKFLSVDPLANNYPWYTPYQFAGNKPTWMVDMDGAEEKAKQGSAPAAAAAAAASGPALPPGATTADYTYEALKANISDMPSSFVTKTGRKIITSVRKNGLKDNQAWFWDKIRTNSPNIKWSEENGARIDNGESPIVDDAFIDQFKAFEGYEKQVLEMNHMNQQMGEGLGLPWQVHRSAGFTKLWHKFGKAVSLGMILLTLYEQTIGQDPLLANDFTKPTWSDQEQMMAQYGLTQGDYGKVVQFASATNARGNNPMRPGTVGIYYASEDEVRGLQFFDLSKAAPGSFIIGGWNAYYPNADAASSALHKKVDFAIIYYQPKGATKFTPVNGLSLAPQAPASPPKSTFTNKLD